MLGSASTDFVEERASIARKNSERKVEKRSDSGSSIKTTTSSFQVVERHPLHDDQSIKRDTSSAKKDNNARTLIRSGEGLHSAAGNYTINSHIGKTAKEISEEEMIKNLAEEIHVNIEKTEDAKEVPIRQANNNVLFNLDLNKVKDKKNRTSFNFFNRKSTREYSNRDSIITRDVSKRSTSTIVLDNCTPDPVEYDFNSDTMQRVYDSIDYGEGSSYEGEIIETTRQRHGMGILTYPNGDVYSGTFVRNLRYGRSDCIYSNNSSSISSFSGFWIWDKINTSKLGKIMYRNGDQYVGQVKAATDDMTTVSISPKNDQMITEGLPHIKRHGRGEFFGSNIKYFGGFANDKMEGFGVMVYMNSDTEEQYYGSFKDNQKNGYGVMIYKDGGFFSGTYVNDVRYGQGILSLSSGDTVEGNWEGDEIKNGIFKKGSVQETPRCTRLLIYEQVKSLEDKHNNYKMHFSHNEYPTLPEKDLISKNKWKGFFIPFVSVIEEEKKKFQGSATHHFIEDRKKSITDSNGRLSPISRKSIQDSLQQYLDGQLSRKLPTDQKIDILQDDDEYVIGEKGVNVLFSILSEFVNLFNWRYYGMAQRSIAREQLPHALDDFYSFVHELYNIVTSRMDAVAIFGAKPLIYLLKNYVLRRIYGTLFSMYKLCYREQDNVYRIKLKSLAQITMAELGIKKDCIPNNTIFAEPLLEAISALQNLPRCHTAHEKFQQLVLTNQQLLDALQNRSVGADELLPIYFYVFIKADVPHIYSEYQFMYDFVDDAVQNSEWGYRFSNFENAVHYVHMLDSNIRDERGILVPTLVLEDRLRDSIEQCMKESRRRDKVHQAPRLLWLSSVFILIGNNSNELSKSSERKFQIQNKQHINMMNVYFEYAKRIVSSVGLQLQRINENNAEIEELPETDSEQWTDVEPKKWRSPNSDDEFGLSMFDYYTYTIIFEQLYPSYVYYRLASKIEEVIDQKEQ